MKHSPLIFAAQELAALNKWFRMTLSADSEFASIQTSGISLIVLELIAVKIEQDRKI